MQSLNIFSNKKVVNTYFDLFFIKFPIWVPLIFLLLVQQFDSHYYYIIIAFLVLGEIHFGITYFFFTEKKYYTLFVKNSFIYLFLPIFLIASLIFLSITFSLSLILFLILLFNFFHVNRQSIGVLKLYSNNSISFILAKFFLYFLSFSLCFVAVLKFILKKNIYFNYEIYIQNFFISAFGFSILVIIFFMIYEKKINLSLLLSFVTGVLIFSPVIFFSKLIDVFAAGVGMHFVQYIALTSVIFNRKRIQSNKDFSLQTDNNYYFYKIYYLIAYLFLYASLMIYFSESEFSYKGEKFGIYLIPVLFQFLHFYFDMFLWRFSSPDVRENLLPFLFKKES
jgi:hypothetical protein